MPNKPLYPNNYPGPGQFALLCEGDRTGYEAALLGRWLRERKPTDRTVDVWPCGTGTAMFAMADALGRTVRVVAIEDRDFRSLEQARLDSAWKLSEREGRNLAMRGWMTWCRNEIENYFLDRDVLTPAMQEVFTCSDGDVNDALALAVESLVVFQAVKVAAAAADDAWAALTKLRYPGGGRPRWTAQGLVAPKPTEIRSSLEAIVAALKKKVYKDERFQEPCLGERLIAEFDARIGEWSAAPVGEDIWRTVWAGKELLKLVRQYLSAKFSAPIESRQERVPPIEWHKIGAGMKSQEIRDVQDALDRDIERAIQPVMIKHLWEYLEADSEADLNRGLRDLGALFVW